MKDVRPFHAQASREIVPTGVSIMFYGKTNTWKSAIAAQFPRPVFFRGAAEPCINHLKEQGFVNEGIPVYTPDHYEELADWTYEAGRGDEYDTIVFDTAYDLQTHLYNFVGEKHFKGEMGEGFDNLDKRGFRAFGKGPDLVVEQYLTPFAKMVTADILPLMKNVVILAHAEVKPVANPGDDAYDQFRPMVDKKFGTRLIAEIQQVCYLGRDVVMEKKKGSPKERATKMTDLFMNFDVTETRYEAKNHYGLPPFIPCGSSAKEAFDALAKAFAESNHPIAGLNGKPKPAAKPAAPARPARPRR